MILSCIFIYLFYLFISFFHALYNLFNLYSYTDMFGLDLIAVIQ